MITYIHRVAVAVSVLLNVLLGGDNNQTFSARNYDWRRRGLPNIVSFIDILFGKHHCLECWAYWKVRKKW
jgi:hypothetical protein